MIPNGVVLSERFEADVKTEAYTLDYLGQI